MVIVYKADPVRGAVWAELMARMAPDLDFRIWPEIGDDSEVEALITWDSPGDLPTRFPRLKAVFSTGAGVDQFDFSYLPDDVHLVRMIESGITDGMVEYVTLAVLALHRNLPDYLEAQKQARWSPIMVRPAHKTRVGVLGLGVLGEAVLRRLADFGFSCSGWSRSGRKLDGIPTSGGPDGLRNMLAQTDVLVCLLPLTDETRGFLNTNIFCQLPEGAHLVHVGRGGHLVEDDLIQALDSGQLSRAILDVTPQEPLPGGHPFWAHPRVWITPHVASMTQPETAVGPFVDNIRRLQQGKLPVGLVNRRRGY